MGTNTTGKIQMFSPVPSGPNAGEGATEDVSSASAGALITDRTEKTTPVNADLIAIADTEASNVAKKVTFTNIKAFLKTYFDTLYGTIAGLATKVDKNADIVGATKTKITYDTKGLVTAGADATTADISDSTNKRYITDAQQTVLSNTS